MVHMNQQELPMFETHWDEDPAVSYMFGPCAATGWAVSFHIIDLIDIKWSEVTMNGFISFNGYFHLKEEKFPKIPYLMVIYTHNNVKPSAFHMYGIVFEKKTSIKDTSKYGTIEDEDESMSVCFFPTEKQRLIFKIVKIFEDGVSPDKAFETMKEFAAAMG